MSILKKILDEMYVEPELLAELDDDQKQVLFCKLREEQVRRYTEFEMQPENGSKAKKSKSVQWLMGADGLPWVWVMGEHPNDKTIEEILDDEVQVKARKLAEQEAETLRYKEEAELKEKLRQELLEIESERVLKKMLADVDKETLLVNGVELMDKTAVLAETSGVVADVSPDPVIIMRRKGGHPPNKNPEAVTELERRLREETDRKIDEEKSRRTSEIYLKLVEAREKVQAEAADAAEEERRYWETQEQKFRQAEEQIKILAQKAREQHRLNIIQTSSFLLNELNNNAIPCKSNKIPSHNGCQENMHRTCKTARLEKAGSRASVIRWFQEHEAPRRAGQLPGTSRMASWFHGILDRQQAESLLAGRPAGSFLVRLNGRIQASYALSYKHDERSPIKHFLIQTSDDGYRFFGDDSQIEHKSLWDMIIYHQTVPITFKDNELLKESVGQNCYPPDYQELLLPLERI